MDNRGKFCDYQIPAKPLDYVTYLSEMLSVLMSSVLFFVRKCKSQQQ